MSSSGLEMTAGTRLSALWKKNSDIYLVKAPIQQCRNTFVAFRMSTTEHNAIITNMDDAQTMEIRPKLQ